MKIFVASALAVLFGMVAAQTETGGLPTTAPTSDPAVGPVPGPTEGPAGGPAGGPNSGPADGEPRWGPRFLRRGPPPEFGGMPPPPFGRGGPGKAFVDRVLARVYPNGAPAQVTDLLAQRTPEAFRQAMDIVRQAAEAQGIQLPGPPGGMGGPFSGPPPGFIDDLLARVYPNGVPAQVTDLLAQGTREARRQAMDIIRQEAEAQGIQLPGPPGGMGPFPGPPGGLLDGLLARVYPNGVPAQVTDLLAQGTPEARRQAMDIVRQEADAQGIQLPGPFPRPPGGAGGPFPGPLRGFIAGVLTRVYPDGVPAQVTDLLAQGTPEALGQAMDIVRQAAEAQGIQLPGPVPRPPGGPGSGPGPFRGVIDGVLARVYPNGVPAQVTDLIAQGTPEALRQAMDIVRQAAEAQGVQLPGRFSGRLGGGGPFPGAAGGPGRDLAMERLLARVYPDGVPAEVTELLGQGTLQARRRVMQLVGETMRNRASQGLGGNDLGRGQGPRGNRIGGRRFRGRFQRPSGRSGLLG